MDSGGERGSTGMIESSWLPTSDGRELWFRGSDMVVDVEVDTGVV